MTETSDLETIPGVGPRTSDAFRALGVHRVNELVDRDPNALYTSYCEIEGGYVDRCVVYVFRCAVYFAETSRPEPELLKWWNWKDRTHRNERGEV